MVSRADAAGSVCRLFVGAPGRTAALARARSHGNARHLDGDRIAAAGLLFVPDSHAPPPLTPARIALLHLLDGAPACSSPAATPPAAPGQPHRSPAPLLRTAHDPYRTNRLA